MKTEVIGNKIRVTIEPGDAIGPHEIYQGPPQTMERELLSTENEALKAATTPGAPPASMGFRVETVLDGKPVQLSEEQSNEWLKDWLKKPPPGIQ